MQRGIDELYLVYDSQLHLYLVSLREDLAFNFKQHSRRPDSTKFLRFIEVKLGRLGLQLSNSTLIFAIYGYDPSTGDVLGLPPFDEVFHQRLLANCSDEYGIDPTTSTLTTSRQMFHSIVQTTAENFAVSFDNLRVAREVGFTHKTWLSMRDKHV